MLSGFRNFFKSKVGIVVTLAFLGLIAFAFASSDVANNATFGGVAGGERVAVVGDEKIGSAEFITSANSALDQVRQENPTISMPAFIEQGGLTEVLDQLIDRFAIGGFAEKYGLRAGDNLVNSEIISIPAFRGADGNFSQEAYLQLLQSRGLTDQTVRRDLGAGLLAKQLLVPASLGATIPDKLVSQYASLLKEQRQGSIAIIPSNLFAPEKAATDAQVQEYYEANRGDYIRPERRVIRYAAFGDTALTEASIEPTANEVTARFEANTSEYAASESRAFTQFIVPTQAAATSIRTRVQGGSSLDAEARQAGLEVATLGPLTKEQLTAQTSAAVAAAVFDAGRGSVAVPARSGLGWHVVRVDAVNQRPARTLDQARSEITTALRAEKRRRALDDLSASVEERLESGESLVDVAKELKLEVNTTNPVLATGQVYGTRDQSAPQILAPALQTAFQMEEGQPQLAEVVRGEAFLIFEASDITPSATAPLSEIRDEVVEAWSRAEGSKGARAAADRIMKRLQDGSTVAQAIAAEDKAIPRPDSIDLTREQIAASGQQVPAPLALMFSMAKGTTKKLEAPRDAGWFVVDLDDIKTGTIELDTPDFQAAKRELGAATGLEYSDQLRLAMRKELGVERNEAAIEAVRKQLSGTN